jgi:enoyl-CoA hydratase
MAAELTVSIEEGILNLTIHRAERRNALNREVIRKIRGALREAAGNSGVRVVTITGSGEKVFCAGADLKAAASGDAGGESFTPGDFRALLMDILQCPKPAVALARGHVLAGGMGILLACDLSLACDDIQLSTPEIHVGMFPMMVLALLYRHVGRKKATEMMFLGERIPAAAAVELGLVNHAFPRSEFDARAGQIVRDLGSKSSPVLQLGKKAIRHVQDRTLLQDLEYLESALAEVMATDDCREGIRAFLEKRKPDFH